MNTIQVDMFEVQLGAAILLQFKVDGDIVRVLADAGVKASGYSATHVRDKLKNMLGERPRIDLIIGTHYDEDHLNGLVPIIDDHDIAIEEAWMPPIANDTQSFPIDHPLTASDLLTYQLADDNGSNVLAAYLCAKRRDIGSLGVIESELDPEGIAGVSRVQWDHAQFESGEDPLDINFFRAQFGDDGIDAQTIDHGCDQEVESDPLVVEMVHELKRGGYSYLHHRWRSARLDGLKSAAAMLRGEAIDLIQPRVRTLAHLRRSAAKDAINAKALYEVLQALKRRGIPVRSEVIDDGTPRRYRWTSASRRFVLARPDTTGLSFDLLGPSKSLVKKHRDRLPVLEAGMIALAFMGEIRSITPSNQLSYIGCFRHDGQSMLVSGDAGCVDFSARLGGYYPKLLAAMTPLHVIQIAHHGGNNAHFYRVLAAASYPEQTDLSYLLLSHATHDRTRPSDVFHDFLLTTLKEGDDVRLLFTSEPKREKVVDYLDAINPAVGRIGEVGDIQLRYDGEWQVTAHAIEVK